MQKPTLLCGQTAGTQQVTAADEHAWLRALGETSQDRVPCMAPPLNATTTGAGSDSHLSGPRVTMPLCGHCRSGVVQRFTSLTQILVSINKRHFVKKETGQDQTWRLLQVRPWLMLAKGL